LVGNPDISTRDFRIAGHPPRTPEPEISMSAAFADRLGET